MASFVLAVVFMGCAESSSDVASDATPAMTTVSGECATVFEGEICTWATLEGDELVTYGATVSQTTVENAPVGEAPVFPPPTLARIAMPEVVQTQLGVNHLGVNWETLGHPPAEYATAHFDFHFYRISGDEVEAIDCSDTTKPDSVPEGYALNDMEIPEMNVTLVGTCVPHMGMHGLVEQEHTDDHGKFHATMVLGYYGAEHIFLEPMIARDLMLAGEDFDLEIPEGFEASEFQATYDAEAAAWDMTFSL